MSALSEPPSYRSPSGTGLGRPWLAGGRSVTLAVSERVKASARGRRRLWARENPRDIERSATAITPEEQESE